MDYFILGIGLTLIIYPIFTAFSELICSIFGMLSNKVDVITAKDTLKVKQLAAKAEQLDDEIHTNVIGFVAPEEYYEEGDEENKHG